MSSYRLGSFLLILVVAALGASPAGAVTPGKTPEGEFPLHITASRLEADQGAGVIVFSGQVKAQYGDATLYADQLRVYFQANPAAKSATAPGDGTPKVPDTYPLAELGGEKITRIVAHGQVRFVQEDKVATGQEAIYYKDKDEVVLLGNPQLWRGENNLKGERIVFNLKKKRVMVESSPRKRVEAHLYSTTQGAPGGKGSLPFGPKPRKGGKP